jgi:SAM-dependent methyltransferase
LGVFHDGWRPNLCGPIAFGGFYWPAGARLDVLEPRAGTCMVAAVPGTFDLNCHGLSGHYGLAMTDPKTIATYSKRASEYLKLNTGARHDPVFQAFLDALPPAADILDLGCGPGTTAAQMMAAGHNVLGLDPTPEFIEIARSKGVPTKLGTFDDVTELAAFDAIWANFSLLHATKTDFRRHLAALHRALRPSGLLHLGMKLGSGQARDTLGRFYAYYSDAELTVLLTEAGFTAITRQFGEDLGLAGDVEPWIVITAHA